MRDSIGTSESLKYTFINGGLRAFVDFTYVEVSIGYCGAGLINETLTVSGSSMSTIFDFSMTRLDIRLIGKYPIPLAPKKMTVFPLAGLVKYFCMSGSESGTDFTSDEKSDFSPWFLMAGFGSDMYLTPKLYLRYEITGAYNLTSKRSASYYRGITYQSSYGWEVQFAAGIGYTF